MPKNFVVEPFCALFQKTSASGKLFVREGEEEYQDSPSKTFCLMQPNILVGEPFSVSLISAIGKILCFRGSSRLFVEVLCLTVPKTTAVVNSSVFHQFRGSKNFV